MGGSARVPSVELAYHVIFHFAARQLPLTLEPLPCCLYAVNLIRGTITLSWF